MSAERADQPKQAVDHHGVPGKALAAEREAMGWTVEQVADQLKLAVRQVIALEEGDYANLPGPAVVRGFVRAYAKILKLDAAPLVAQIALDSPTGDTVASGVRRDHKPTSFSQSRYPSNGKRKSNMPMVLGVVAVIGVIGAGVAAWQFKLVPAGLFGSAAAPVVSSPAAVTDSTVTTLPAPMVNVPAATVEPAKTDALPPVISNPVPLISVPPASQPSDPMTAPAGIAPAAPAATAPGETAAATSNALVLTVRQDSWVEVRTSGGKSLLSRLMKAGQSETVTVSGPATLILGNPSGVDASLRGTPVPMPTTTAGKVARIALK